MTKLPRPAGDKASRLRYRFEQPTTSALALVPAGRVLRSTTRNAAHDIAKPGKRKGRGRAAAAVDPDLPEPSMPQAGQATQPPPAAHSALEEEILARLTACEEDGKQPRADLQQRTRQLEDAQAKLTTVKSQLALAQAATDKRLQDEVRNSMARENGIKDSLQGKLSSNSSDIEYLSRRFRASNIVMYGVDDTPALSRSADLERYVKRTVDDTVPGRSSTVSQGITAVSHIGRPGSNKQAVLVECNSLEAKHRLFQQSSQLRSRGFRLAEASAS